MAEHENARLVREAWLALVANNPGPLYELTHEDAVLHMGPGQAWVTGTYKGRDEAFAILMKSGEATRNSMKLEVHDVVANDDHAIALLRFGFDRDDLHLEGPEVWVSHMAGGKITETWVFIDDQADAQRFWSVATPDD
jgi:ketosteroid isomerase-like protein